MSLYDPFDNTPPQAATLALAAAFDNTPAAPLVDPSLTRQVFTATNSRTNVNVGVDIVGSTIGGHVVIDTEPVLLMGQTNAAENGFWRARVGQAPIRDPIMDTQAEANANISAIITGVGATDLGKIFVLVTPPPINLGVTPLNYQEKSALPRTI
jgi:hypothetical protein